MSKKYDQPRIRPFHPSDLHSLVEVYNRSFPGSTKNSSELGSNLLRAKWPESQVWVITLSGRPAGYAQAVRIPGLDKHYELSGWIHPKVRHQGLGSSLLANVLKELRIKGVRTISYAANEEPDPGSVFLLKRGFSTEHQEWIMELDEFPKLTEEAVLPASFDISTYPKGEAAPIFRDLYEQVFKNYPWYQPYESEEQVAEELIDPVDLLFLRRKEENLGFCWCRRRDLETGEIEPVGLLRKYRGRGLGKRLILEGIFRLQSKGISRVHIGVWEENKPAINLYHRVGFRNIETVTHIGIDLHSNI